MILQNFRAFRTFRMQWETCALETQHLKVKDIEWDIILIKNYCIIIRMEKISSIYKFNLKI